MSHSIYNSAMSFIKEVQNLSNEDEDLLLSTGCRFDSDFSPDHPDFAGLTLEVPQWEKINLLSRINALIVKWIPHFASLGDLKFNPSPRAEEKIIRLYVAEHCTLFKFFFNTSNYSNTYQEAIKNLYGLYENTEPDPVCSVMCSASKPAPGSLSTGTVYYTCTYLLYVPGVVLGLAIDLEPDFVSIPKAVNVADSDGTVDISSNDVEAFLQSLDSKLLIEENHSPHITLGINSEYKPVITGLILNSIYDLANLSRDKYENEFEVYSANEHGTVSRVIPGYLFDTLKISRSGPPENPECLLPTVVAASNRVSSTEYSIKPFNYKEDSDSGLDFSTTVTVVANDLSLFYFKNLPVNDIKLDVYLMPVGGDRRVGKVKHFN